MKVATGVHRVGNGTINAYMLEEAGAVTVIDAGVPGLWGRLLAELAAMGRSLADVRAILLTHGHLDHIGYAERLRRATRAPARVHELDVLLAQGKVPNPSKGFGHFHWRPILSFLAYAVRNRYGLGPHLGEVIGFGDGATLDVPGSPRVIHVPGHTPGSAAPLASGHGALFIGDAIVTRSIATGRLGPQVGPFTADRPTALASLGRLEGVRGGSAASGPRRPVDGRRGRSGRAGPRRRGRGGHVLTLTLDRRNAAPTIKFGAGGA